MKNVVKGILIIVLLGTSFNSMATDCSVDGTGGVFNLNGVAIPSDAPIGSKLWTRDVTVNVTCDPPFGVTSEKIYFYANPNSVSIGNGLAVGIVLDGRDLGVSYSKVDIGWTVYRPLGNNSRTFQIIQYLKKTGPIPESYNGPSSLTAFKLEGTSDWEVNHRPFSQALNGFDKMRIMGCSVNIPTVTDVDFQNIQAWKGQDIGKEVARKRFSIHLTKTCEAPFSLDARFTSASAFVGSSRINLGNGSELQLIDTDTGRPVLFGRMESFADMTTQNSFVKNYDAVIKSTGKAVIGNFVVDVIYVLNYK